MQTVTPTPTAKRRREERNGLSAVDGIVNGEAPGFAGLCSTSRRVEDMCENNTSNDKEEL